MYCKLFSSLYQGTLRGRPDEILVFTNLLAHADQFGIVDKHFRAISEEVGIPVERVRDSILVLESPDPESRSPEENGARLLRLDEHRVWGWKIVNYGKYRAIKNEDDRREQNRLAQERFRNKKNKQPSATVSSISPDKPPSAQAEAEAEAEADHSLSTTPAPERISVLHGWYSEQMGGEVRLDSGSERLWFEWIRGGFEDDDFKRVFKHVHAGIQRGERNQGALKLVNILSDGFAADLLIAKQNFKTPTKNAKPERERFESQGARKL